MPARRALLPSLVLLVLHLGCGLRGEEALPDGPPPATYRVRGLVRQIDHGSIGKTQISIQHEEIPDFIGITGEVEGMRSMTMPFTVAGSVDLAGVEPGSMILFELVVDWAAPDPALITGIEVLPFDTELDFGDRR